MQRLWILSAVVAVALIGCNSSERGGKVTEDTKGSETFKLKGPATGTTIKQGDKQTVKLTIDRGKNFKQDVALTVDAPPKGLAVTLEPTTVKASDAETATATVTAAADAPVGEHTFTVKATPAKGNAVDIGVKVTVEKKAD